MARIDELRTRLSQYVACESAILSGAQSYSIAGRSLTRANLSEISSMIRYLENEIAAEEAKSRGQGRNKVFGVIPRDF
ncbi:DUF6148 family protein [Paenibacillus campinasensis]|uniref:Uncharacterized protein n=1 Tax=Paenibacillus campinasensis TaxID=66347 RepID=A0A268ELA8_9BACL|nr:DUF6148 family protein [Paenibacillus campinasensis]PAD73902.1 hypothetical protein CHH67_18880 [Paenibacillus campinasensis]